MELAGPRRRDGRQAQGTSPVFASAYPPLSRLPHDPPVRPARDHLPLQAAGRVRRAPDDVPAARQLRPAAARVADSTSRRSRLRCAGCTTCSAIASRVARFRGSAPRSCASRATSGSITRRPNAPDFQIEDYARTYPFAYGAEEMPDLAALDRAAVSRSRASAATAGRGGSSSTAGPTDTGDLLMTLTYAHQGELHLRRGAPRRARRSRSTTLALRQRHLPRLRAADDGGGALARLRRALRLRLHLRARPRRAEPSRRRLHPCLVQVYLPGAGWVEFDPTNGIVGNRDLIRVAVARDPRQAMPLSGTWIGIAATASA